MTDAVKRKVGKDRNGKPVLPSLRVPWEVGTVLWVQTSADKVTVTTSAPCAKYPSGDDVMVGDVFVADITDGDGRERVAISVRDSFLVEHHGMGWASHLCRLVRRTWPPPQTPSSGFSA